MIQHGPGHEGTYSKGSHVPKYFGYRVKSDEEGLKCKEAERLLLFQFNFFLFCFQTLNSLFIYCIVVKPFTSGWDLNPCGWDSNPAKTHSDWFQDLMKLRFLMSHHRRNSVRDKVIAKKWIYSDSERSTLHRQSMGHHRGRVQPYTIHIAYQLVIFTQHYIMNLFL